ncbi:MAG: DUF58 domain-containing protein [Haloferacaceae archaeon]
MLPTSLAPSVQLTRRGRSVAFVCLLGIAMAWVSGPRALNAVVVPGLVGLAAGYLQLRAIEAPRVVRDLPPDAHAESTHELRLRFVDAAEPTEGVASPFVATVTERVDDGLELSEPTLRTTVGAEEVRLRIGYRRRGERTVGPTELVATDVLGLVRRELVCDSVDTVLVYPERSPIPRWFRRGLYDLEEANRSRQRDEFDRLREYEEGDPLRDVHWPATARKDEPIVKEFVAEGQGRSVSVSVGGRGADRSAAAAASVALALLEDGVPVRLSAPNGRVETFPGGDTRPLLELLARMSRGEVPDPDADVVIDGGHRRTRIQSGEESHSLAGLREETGSGAEKRPSGEATTAATADGGETA